MTDNFNNRLQIFNEIVVLICIWLLFHSTQFVESPEQRYDLGWYFLYFVAFNVGVNILFVIYITIKKIYQKIRICCFKRQAKNQKDIVIAPKKAEIEQAEKSKEELEVEERPPRRQNISLLKTPDQSSS